MTGFLTILTVASASVLSYAVPAPVASPPPLELMKPLPAGRNAHEDLYIAVSPDYGMYRVPTWLRVASWTNHTDLTGASFIWRSGLEWFDNVDWHINIIGGRFMEWNTSYVEVTAFLSDGDTVTLDGWYARKPGCWTDYDHWYSPSFVDQYGATWPDTQLQFDFPNMELQSLLYHIPSANRTCTVRTYTMQYTFFCEGIQGDLGTTREWYPWPVNEDCIPAKEHNTTEIHFEGKDGAMTLYLSDGIEQVFQGTSIVGQTMPKHNLIADADSEEE